MTHETREEQQQRAFEGIFLVISKAQRARPAIGIHVGFHKCILLTRTGTLPEHMVNAFTAAGWPNVKIQTFTKYWDVKVRFVTVSVA